MIKNTSLSIFAGLSWVITAAAPAVDLYVSPDGNQTPPFANWAQAARNIQAAVNAASEGDTIYLADHNYLLKETITVDKAITIKGFSGPDDCVVDGRNNVRCFDINDASLVDLTIQHGFIRGEGLGNPVRKYGGGVYARNCVILSLIHI